MEKLFGILKIIEDKNARHAAEAIVISAFVCGLAILPFSVQHDKDGWRFAVPEDYKIGLAIAYFVIFIASWFILYLLNRKDGADVYTDVRERIVGAWNVSYAADYGPASGEMVVPRRAIGCYIGINPQQKLELVFKVKGNPIFSDSEREIIKDVALRYNDEGGYTMFYYLKENRELQPHVAMHILPEEGHNKINDVEIEVFGRVSFDKPPRGKHIVHMEGRWYDLNGNISRLFAFLDQKKAAEIKNEPFTGLRLSQVPIHQKNFDADMGVIEFDRTLD